jgi:hypothetical protein
VNHVVTSIRDSFHHFDDVAALSLREAIDLANENDGTAETVWMPAWNFVLTRERTGGVGTTDIDIAFGDLDIADSLTVRGVSTTLTTLRWRQGVVDALFDLLGDYNGNGLAGGTADDGYVNGRDFLEWQRFSPSADGDDDGDVDGDDLAIWQNNYGNTLTLDPSVTVILA